MHFRRRLLPTIFLIVYDSLATHESARQIPPIAQAADQLAKLISGMPWDDIRWGELDEVTDRLDKAVAAARELEELVSRANDLLAQLPLQYGIVERLLEAGETVVNDGPEREAAWDLFGAGELLDNPSSREYVLKMTAPRNRSETEATLQRFWFQLRDGEVRVVECLSRRD